KISARLRETPRAKLERAIGATAAGTARRATGRPMQTRKPSPTSSGRRGRILSARAPPSSEPTPSAATIAAQALEPPSSSLATVGPRTWKQGKKIALVKAAEATIVHSQVREENSFQPRRSSAKKAGSSRSASGGACIRKRKKALAPKVAASKAIA